MTSMEAAIAIILFAAALTAGIVLLRRQSAPKGRWGIGSLQAVCPRCRAAVPTVRVPGSLHEMLWGGWTCPQCGCKVDKYGRERVEP
jgi:hypothetical protein